MYNMKTTYNKLRQFDKTLFFNDISTCSLFVAERMNWCFYVNNFAVYFVFLLNLTFVL